MNPGLLEIESAISNLRFFLQNEIVASINGKEIFEPQKEWENIANWCAKIRANDHVLSESQKLNLTEAISRLQLNLNSVLDILRYASERKVRNFDTAPTLRNNLEVALAKTASDFEQAARIHFESTGSSFSPVVNYGSIHMGDVFSNIANSTVISKSTVERAFNKLNDAGETDTARLIIEISNIVANANNHAAGAVFAQIADQASKDTPDKGVIKSCWDGLVVLIPAVASLSSQVLKAFGLG